MTQVARPGQCVIWICLAFSLAIGLPTPIVCGQDESKQFRTWKDRSGKYQIEAMLIRVDEGKVRLEKRDGAKIEIQFNDLSKADQNYLSKSPSSDDPAPSDAPEMPVAGIVKLDSRETVQLSLEIGDQWQFRPNPQPPGRRLPSHAIGLTRRNPDRLVFSPNNTKALVYYDHPLASRLNVCDLISGQVSNAGEVPDDFGEPVSISNDDQYIATHRNNVHEPAIGIWTIRDDALVQVVAWEVPYLSPRNKAIIEFLSGTSLLASALDLEHFAVVDPRTAKVECLVAKTPGTGLAISRDKRTIVFHHNEHLYVLDVGKREIVARTKCPRRGLRWLALSPDNSQVACVGKRMARVFDMRTGQKTKEFATHEFFETDRIVWKNERYLVAHGNTVIHCLDTIIQTRIETITTTDHFDFHVTDDGQFWIAIEREIEMDPTPEHPNGQRRPMTVLSTCQVPSSKAVAMFQSIDARRDPLIAPGLPVSVVVETNLDDEFADSAQRILSSHVLASNEAITGDLHRALVAKVHSSLQGNKHTYSLEFRAGGKKSRWTPKPTDTPSKDRSVRAPASILLEYKRLVIPEFVTRDYLARKEFDKCRRFFRFGKLIFQDGERDFESELVSD